MATTERYNKNKNMKKLLFILLGALTFQCSQAQPPFTIPDNIGSGNCLDFNNNGYVDCGNIGDLGNAYSIEAWGAFDAGTVGYIASYRTDNQPNSFNIAMELTVSSGSVYFSARNSSLNTATISYPLNPGEWYHFAGVRNGDNLELFINGNSVGTGSAPFGTIVMNHLDIGCTFDDGGNAHQTFIGGQIDEVRVWSEARSQSQIKDNMCLRMEGNETNLAAYWRMNEGNGNTVTDLTPNGNNGTLQP